jgi:dynein heavy chain, axonemal
VAGIDQSIEEALKKAVKISLLELQKIIGDDKPPIPIFKLSVELEMNTTLGFNPTTDYLINMIRQTTAAMTEVIRDFKRMENLIIEERKK